MLVILFPYSCPRASAISSFEQPSLLAVVANVWYNGAVTFGGSILTVYINGIQVNASTPTVNTGLGSLILGRFVTNVFPLAGNIAQYSLYDRALSAQEILRNYEATKTRFGL